MKDIITNESQKYRMTRKQLLAFVGEHRMDIMRRASGYGVWRDLEDGFGQLVCKILKTPIENGHILKFTEFIPAKTTKDWIGWLVGQLRARVGAVRTKRLDMYVPVHCLFKDGECGEDSDEEESDGVPSNEMATACGEDGVPSNEELEHEVEVEPDFDEADFDEAELADDSAEVSPKSAVLSRSEKRNISKLRRVSQYQIYLDDLKCGCHILCPDEAYDRNVSKKAAWAVLDGLRNYHGVSKRNIDVYIEAAMYMQDAESVAQKFEINVNNLYQIVHKVSKKLKMFGPRLYRNAQKKIFLEAA